MTTINDLKRIQKARTPRGYGWGWCYAPENIEDDYKCVVTDCPLPTIFEGYPDNDTSVWYSICAWHGWMLGMHAIPDEDHDDHKRN